MGDGTPGGGTPRVEAQTPTGGTDVPAQTAAPVTSRPWDPTLLLL